MPKIEFPDNFSRYFYLFLASLNILASALYFAPSFFTWWSFQAFLLLLLSAAFDLLTTELCTFCLFNASFVMIGVFVMSVIRSEGGDDMLTRTAASAGLGLYALQTFAVHYLPWIVTASTLPRPGPSDLEQLSASLACAVSFFAIYLGLFDPEDVYGVPVSSTTGFVIAAAFLVVVTAGLRVAGFE